MKSKPLLEVAPAPPAGSKEKRPTRAQSGGVLPGNWVEVGARSIHMGSEHRLAELEWPKQGAHSARKVKGERDQHLDQSPKSPNPSYTEREKLIGPCEPRRRGEQSGRQGTREVQHHPTCG